MSAKKYLVLSLPLFCLAQPAAASAEYLYSAKTPVEVNWDLLGQTEPVPPAAEAPAAAPAQPEAPRLLKPFFTELPASEPPAAAAPQETEVIEFPPASRAAPTPAPVPVPVPAQEPPPPPPRKAEKKPPAEKPLPARKPAVPVATAPAVPPVTEETPAAAAVPAAPPAPEKTAAPRPEEKPRQPAEKAAQELPAVPTTSDLTLEFAAGSSDVSPEATKKLDNLVAQLRDLPDMRLQIRAYAKGDGGGPSSARRLALSRGLMVRAYLVEKGLKPVRLDVRALGEETDQAPLDRVDIVFAR